MRLIVQLCTWLTHAGRVYSAGGFINGEHQQGKKENDFSCPRTLVAASVHIFDGQTRTSRRISFFDTCL